MQGCNLKERQAEKLLVEASFSRLWSRPNLNGSQVSVTDASTSENLINYPKKSEQ